VLVGIETIEQGAEDERVRSSFVEGKLASGEWQTLCMGSGIGHKHTQPTAPLTVVEARLNVLSSDDTPLIRRFALFGKAV